MNLASIITGAAVVLVLLLAIGFMTKNGTGSSCGGNCSACGMAESCHKEDKK